MCCSPQSISKSLLNKALGYLLHGFKKKKSIKTNALNKIGLQSNWKRYVIVTYKKNNKICLIQHNLRQFMLSTKNLDKIEAFHVVQRQGSNR